MKTINRASSPTIKFLGYLKFPLFLAILVFALSLAGGQKIPLKPSPGNATAIGGQHVPRDTSPPEISLSVPIGGDNQSKPKPSDPFGYTDIGGQRIPGDPQPPEIKNGGHDVSVAIGGGGTGSQVPTDPKPVPVCTSGIEIGGQKVPPDTTPIGLMDLVIRNENRLNTHVDIGGNQGVPQVPGIPCTFALQICLNKQQIPKVPSPLG